MRKGLLVLLTLAACGAAARASAQTVQLERQDLVARVSPDVVVARMMSFDSNRNGRLERTELVERMQPVVVRGDRNGDRTLDRSEIERLIRTTPAAQTFPLGSGYGFADQEGVSSRNHIEGALDDLRLASSTRTAAVAVVDVYVDALDRRLSAEMLKEMRDILSPEQFLDFKYTLTSRQRAQTGRPASATGSGVSRAPVRGRSLDALVRQYGLSPSELQRATAAIDRYNTRLRLGDGAGRDELLAELSAILTEEERGNFGAALARRPVVPKAGPLFMAGNGAGVTLSDNVSRQLAQTLEVLRQGK